MKNKKNKMEESSKIEDDLSIEEAIFLIEWGMDLDDYSKINQNSKKKVQA